MITYAGNWREDERIIAQLALFDVSVYLEELTGIESDEAFHRLFGDLTLEAVKSAGRYWARVDAWDTHKMLFTIGRVTPNLVIHELGHLMNDNLPEQDSPAHLLSVHGIKTPDGKLVTGSGASGYARNAGRYAPRNGYRKDNYPFHQHPRNWVNGNTCVEDWADMFLSWVTDNFTDDERGQAIMEFVEGYLRGRLA
jgi:hypothetical protein